MEVKNKPINSTIKLLALVKKEERKKKWAREESTKEVGSLQIHCSTPEAQTVQQHVEDGRKSPTAE